MSPVAVALIIGVVTGVLGAAIYWVQRRTLFRGYEQIAEATRQIAGSTKAEVFRDSDDLVIAGSFQSFPTIVRFSYNQNTPGMHLQMRAPAMFDLLVSPKKIATGKGRMVVRTGNNALDSRFTVRTDHPTQTRMLFADKAALAHLEKLCCSTQTDFAISSGNLELNELSIPAYPARHVLDHLESLTAVARLLTKMPGADAVRLEPVREQRRGWVFQSLGVVLLIVVMVLLFSHSEKNAAIVHESVPLYVPVGMEPLDAGHLQRLEGWRIAATDDFSPAAAQYLEQHSLQVIGRAKGDFVGRGGSNDSAYLLIDDQGKRRLSILANGIAAYDAIFAKLDLIATVPRANLANIPWAPGSEVESDGDGLLIVQDTADPTSGLVLMRHGKQTNSAHPVDFTQINLYSE